MPLWRWWTPAGSTPVFTLCSKHITEPTHPQLRSDLSVNPTFCVLTLFLGFCLGSLYLNPLSDVGKQSLYARGVSKSPSNRQVKVLASVTEGSDISENWHPILSVIRENASSWDRSQVTQQLKVSTQRNRGVWQSHRNVLCEIALPAVFFFFFCVWKWLFLTVRPDFIISLKMCLM